MHRLRFHAPFTSFSLLSYIKYLCAGLRWGRRRAVALGTISAGRRGSRERPHFATVRATQDAPLPRPGLTCVHHHEPGATGCMDQLNVTSNTIIVTNPTSRLIVARSVFPCLCDSGITSSPTTKIIAPAAKARAYGSNGCTINTTAAPRTAATGSTTAESWPYQKLLIREYPSRRAGPIRQSLRGSSAGRCRQ